MPPRKTGRKHQKSPEAVQSKPREGRVSALISHPAAKATQLTKFGAQWRHWAMIQGKLYAPDGHAYSPEELLALRENLTELRGQLNACEAQIAELKEQLQQAVRTSIEDQPLP